MKTTQWLGCLAVCTLTFGFTAHASANITVIDTSTPLHPDEVSQVGETSSTATALDSFGQTITVADANTTLESFSFFAKLAPASPNDARLSAYVMAWDDTNKLTVGPVLFRSAMQTITASNITEYNFNTGGLTLTQGQQYMLFLSAAELFDGNPDAAFLALRNSNPYAGGGFYYHDSGGDFPKTSTTPWGDYFSNLDLEIIANFSDRVVTPTATAATPEPASAALLALGATALGMTTRRRRQQR